jgi:ElaA protein
MAKAIERAESLWPGQRMKIGAQQYLQGFYGDFGFVQSSEPYDEDGIQHIEMVREAESSTTRNER